MSNDSEIVANQHGAIGFHGRDATELYRVMVLRQGLKLLKVGIAPTRGFTYKKGLAIASVYTGRTYKRSEVDQAVKDLTVWIETMKSAIPVITTKE